MNDIRQTGIKINLDKERKLIYDLNAFCDLEEKYGTVENAMQEIQKGSMLGIRYFLFLGLKNEDEQITEREVGKLITTENMKNVIDGITKAINISLPEASDEKK
ncbi:MAG: hypothetical protein A2Y24_06885 [Clostridiales bacterium GWE2_32_10]|nr:MAG: hypothetical protein A2Y24_06885 [Clostridiales bacterium GWE2_32_10]HBY19978.1 hypothetical protein [Clostridiales bacterium]